MRWPGTQTRFSYSTPIVGSTRTLCRNSTAHLQMGRMWSPGRRDDGRPRVSPGRSRYGRRFGNRKQRASRIESARRNGSPSRNRDRFRQDVLERHPWRSFGKAEDAEYSAILRRAGVRVTFVPTAALRNTPPTDTAGLCQQRRRWRDALFTDAAGPIDRLLTSKPLILAQLAVTCGVVGLMALLNPGAVTLAFAIWAGILVTATMAVYLRAAGRTGATPRAMFGLWRTPAVVGRLACRVTAGGLARRGGASRRTPRAANA